MLRNGVVIVSSVAICPGEAVYLPAVMYGQELYLKDPAPLSQQIEPSLQSTRLYSMRSPVLQHGDAGHRVDAVFRGGQGVFGERIPTVTMRHPVWHPEFSRLGRYHVYVCCAVLFVAGVLCAAGGIGGGGIYVTLLMVAGKLGVTDAVPLSKAIVFFGSISSLVLNSRKLVSWETKRETAIDYNICRVVVPGSLSGTLVGVILNRRLPSWIILLVLCVILIVITLSVALTTVKQYVQEWVEAIEDAQLEAEVVEKAAEVTTPPAPHNAMPGGQSVQHPVSARKIGPPLRGSVGGSLQQLAMETLSKPRRMSGVRRPSMNAPDITKMRNRVLWSDIVLSLGILSIVITAGVLRFHVGECFKADPAAQAKICNHPALFWLRSGTLESWIQHNISGIIRHCTIVVPLCLCTLVELCYARLLIKFECWRWQEVLLYCLVATFTGCLSGLIGIGGGLIFSPFFLLSGVHPSVAVATSSTCVIFTSSSTSLQYLLTDRIITSLTLVYGTVSLAASYLGTSFVHFLEEHFWGRKSYVSFVVCLGVLLSTVLSILKLSCMSLK